VIHAHKQGVRSMTGFTKYALIAGGVLGLLLVAAPQSASAFGCCSPRPAVSYYPAQPVAAAPAVAYYPTRAYVAARYVAPAYYVARPVAVPATTCCMPAAPVVAAPVTPCCAPATTCYMPAAPVTTCCPAIPVTRPVIVNRRMELY
jgi:hypothetical protein